MCTAIAVQAPGGNFYFGRTMDFSYQLDPELYAVPRGYSWRNLSGTHQLRNRYAFMGIGQNLNPVIFADGVNEMGFAAAVLYFPGYAQYHAAGGEDSQSPYIAALEVVHLVLGLCDSVRQAAALLPTIRIVGLEDPVTNSVAPLHWLLADRSGACMTVEKTASGLHVMENPIGVLANSPDFQWHMTNLRNYLNLTPAQESGQMWGQVELIPFGQGAGMFGMPGDYTPPSRFVRTAFQKSHVLVPAAREGAVTACFHMMNSVTIPKGVVMTGRGTPDYTQYTAFMDLTALEYFFRTYDDSRIVSVKWPSDLEEGTSIVSLTKLNRPVSFSDGRE